MLLINNKYFRSFIFHFFNSQNNFNQFELKFQKIIEMISFKNNFDIYNSVTTNSFKNNVLMGGNPKEYNPILSQLDFNNNFTEIQMLADIMTYLPDDILCKVDRASMANSLEIRSPYLNHKIAEFAFSLPLNYKIDNNNSKLILRNILNKYLPSSVYDQPKIGFSFPFSDMIKKDLKEFIYYTLSSSKISSLLNKKQVYKIIEEHNRKRNDKSNLIWSLLMFQKWIEYQ